MNVRSLLMVVLFATSACHPEDNPLQGVLDAGAVRSDAENVLPAADATPPSTGDASPFTTDAEAARADTGPSDAAAGEVPETPFASGERLRARVLRTPDEGFQQLIGFYDAELEVDCAYVAASGETRVHPGKAGAASLRGPRLL